ncbi:hypothetical protein [Pedobacter nutrimenti]|uniref:hypothetical protein n=1 Tax=Pedobacter nutrimenti TaxID=1241337 RepID=UPI00292F989A|nr:hypothetical protein [Pedobacter nutrimenti]
MQDDCYQQVVENPALFEEKNDFLKLCTLNAYDSIIISREIVDISEYNFLKVFEEKFLGRTSKLARVIYNLLLILLFWGLYKVLIKYPNIQEAVGDFGLIVGLAGVSAANFLSSVCKKIEIVIRKLLGYR